MSEKRKQKRVPLKDTFVTISIGNRILTCDVENVSFNGLRATIPAKFLPNGTISRLSLFTAIVSHRSTSIKLNIAPRWCELSNSLYADVGFHLPDLNMQWRNFLQKAAGLRIPVERDVWGLEGQKYMSR